MFAQALRFVSVFTFAVLAARIFAQGDGPGTGTIHGLVLNEIGTPVAKALVNADLVDGKIRAKALQYVETDEQGHFTIEHLEWGSYRLFTKKEQDGYPNTRFAFYGPDPPPTVSVTAQAPKADITLRIGPKAGKLRILSVTDATTGKDLTNVSGVDLRRTGMPRTFIGLGPSDNILIPSGIDVTIKIESNGYEQWPPVNQSQLGQIRLAPEQVFDLRVQLQPLSGLNSEIERIVKRAADANRLVWTGKKVVGPFPPSEEDVQRLRQSGIEGMQILSEYLRAEADPLEQGGVVSLLASLGDDRSLDLLDEFAEKAQDAMVRVNAVKWLLVTKRPKDMLLLQQISRSDPDSKVREAAAKLLKSNQK